MNIQQTTTFRRNMKKLPAAHKQFVDTAVRAIADQPQIGQQKKGALAAVRVYKFKIKHQQLLLAYIFTAPATLTLLALNSHENFYRDLRKQL